MNDICICMDFNFVLLLLVMLLLIVVPGDHLFYVIHHMHCIPNGHNLTNYKLGPSDPHGQLKSRAFATESMTHTMRS